MAGAIVDDDLAHAAILDANFEENRGGCLYLLLILHHGAPGHYMVEIEIINAPRSGRTGKKAVVRFICCR